MPKIGGDLATRAIRSLGYEGVIVGLTAVTDRAVTEAFLEAGCNYIFTKPLEDENLRFILDCSSGAIREPPRPTPSTRTRVYAHCKT
jgi:AmiR/NasT family two-component response regulator